MYKNRNHTLCDNYKVISSVGCEGIHNLNELVTYKYKLINKKLYHKKSALIVPQETLTVRLSNQVQFLNKGKKI